MTVKFTIIVPTRDRADTLLWTIKNLLQQKYENYIILVSDNASVDDTKSIVSNIDSHKIQYINTNKRVSMSENWEFALNHIEDGWVSIIGDDDGLFPNALSRVSEIIENTGIKAVRSNGCSYHWPGVSGSQYGRLSVNIKDGYTYESSLTALQKVLNGSMDYNRLPMLYNGGFVSFELIKKAKSISGKFFHSMTPDVYSAIVLSLLTTEYIYTDEALAVNGASLHSTGTASFAKKISKGGCGYDPVEKFFSEGGIPCHSDLPLTQRGRFVTSLPATVYEAYLQAAPFHLKNVELTNHQQQLEVVLSVSGSDKGEIIEWANSFSELHDLDLIKATKKSQINQIFNVKRVKNLYDSVFNRRAIMGSENIPLYNVVEAVIAAESIRNKKKSSIAYVTDRLKDVLIKNFKKLNGGL